MSTKLRKTSKYNTKMKKYTDMAIDEFDHRILDIVQNDNLRTHSEIAVEVNLSASSVRRRLSKLRETGVIIGDVSLVDPAKQGLMFLVHVRLEVENQDGDEDFKKKISSDPAVSQCYSISGEFDYFLVVHSASPEVHELWAERSLLSHPAVHRYSTSLVWSRTKFTTFIPQQSEM